MGPMGLMHGMPPIPTQEPAGMGIEQMVQEYIQERRYPDLPPPPARKGKPLFHPMFLGMLAANAADIGTTVAALKSNPGARETNQLAKGFATDPLKLALFKLLGLGVQEGATRLFLDKKNPTVANIARGVAIGVPAAAAINNLGYIK